MNPYLAHLSGRILADFIILFYINIVRQKIRQPIWKKGCFYIILFAVRSLKYYFLIIIE